MPVGHNTSRSERPRRTPPHVPLKAVRLLVGLRLDDLAHGVERLTGVSPSRGTLSAIESGRRGASPELLDAIGQVIGLEPGDITTNYRPRTTPGKAGGGA